MAQLLIRGLNARVVERLKTRARRHGRSLEAELRGILEGASATDFVEARTLAARLQRRLAGRRHTDSAALLAEDRGR